MSRILGSWSNMRKYLEKEIIAECLKGKIRYGCTTYKGMDDFKIFEICIDGKQAKRFSIETVNTYFINNGFKTNCNPIGKIEYWSEFWEILDKTPMESRSEFTEEEFCEALREYRNQNIQSSLFSDNPLVRMFAVLDRRIGKRTLLNVKNSVSAQPEWLQQFYNLRISAESV